VVDIIKFIEGWVGMDWIGSFQDIDQWGTLMNMVVNHGVA
jgi:hypothetical protein